MMVIRKVSRPVRYISKAVVNLQEAASKSCQLDALHGEVVLVYFLRFHINNLRWQHLHVNEPSLLGFCHDIGTQINFM